MLSSLLLLLTNRLVYAAGQQYVLDNKLSKERFLDELIAKLTVEELAQQLHLTFSDNVVFNNSQNFDSYNGDRGIGIIHDWYPTNASQYNALQKLNLEKMRVPIPFMQTGECLHGVGSSVSKWSVFPQQLGMAASFDQDLVYRCARAIATEARSMGIHACFSPVLDLAKDPRWGRVQEGYGEDFVLTSKMGVASTRGLSKDGNHAHQDAVVPVMKHFAAHGSPLAGSNSASYMGYGLRQVKSEMLVPFKAAVQLGGVKGVMMAYSDIDGIPSSVDTMLYDALHEWGFDGYVQADDTAVGQLYSFHYVAKDGADAISQWLDAGGQVQFYDFPLQKWTNHIVSLVKEEKLSLDILKKRVRGPLGVKYDLGLFNTPFIPKTMKTTDELADAHIPLTLEAALNTIVLLENRNDTLPIRPEEQGIRKISLVGPFADSFNFGDYTAPWGSSPISRANTVRSALAAYLAANASDIKLTTNWGSDSWLYRGQYSIPPDLLMTSDRKRSGGLLATYYALPNLTHPVFTKFEAPNLDWGMYPPNGLPSDTFSVIWEGVFHVPYDAEGWLGIAIGLDSAARLIVDDHVLVNVPRSHGGNMLGNMPGYYASTKVPPGMAEFTFKAGAIHRIRVEFRNWNLAPTEENVSSTNSQVQLIWNPAGKNTVEKAVGDSKDADLIIFVGGAAWNSDGEGADSATLGLSPNQTTLLDRLYDLGKPVVLILQGGRPFVVTDCYSKSSAVLSTYFPGQQFGRAITEILFGLFNPGGRLPMTIPSSLGSIPAYYNHRPGSTRRDRFVDVPTMLPAYPFGHGLSYTQFIYSRFRVVSSSGSTSNFSAEDILTFHFQLENVGKYAGSDVPQIYLLGRTSVISQPVKQLVAFDRVYLYPGESKVVTLDLDPSRYLLTLNRTWGFEVEQGNYTFALLRNGGILADTSTQNTMTCIPS